MIDSRWTMDEHFRRCFDKHGSFYPHRKRRTSSRHFIVERLSNFRRSFVIVSSKVFQCLVACLSMFRHMFVNVVSKVRLTCPFLLRQKTSDIQPSCHFFVESLSMFRRRFVTFSSWVCHSYVKILSLIRQKFVTYSLKFCHYFLNLPTNKRLPSDVSVPN
jgi:hypothetical protein